MACLFCEILAGGKPASIVTTDPAGTAFLDIRPVFKGHTLVVPPTHIETLADLPASDLAGFFGFVQRIAVAVQEGLGAQGTFVAMNNVVSQSVPHLHVHVVPRTKGDGLRGFFWPRTKYASSEEAESYAADIRAKM
ncbi:histidine triad (HIT) family protein [Kibdelosporangium banguiense]|uniref:Histidine triad (HIT) family protein n=1 Tax=Kibdelosporangium banguiense TaxID=1365924 RepID=A0ABS4TN62_9PSEU|nr:HIT family protein [Kibdelosporangium banguiense]MBP2325852.1 histidine triad (HIT) family protein [Kibdelosporangium banguiense]